MTTDPDWSTRASFPLKNGYAAVQDHPPTEAEPRRYRVVVELRADTMAEAERLQERLILAVVLRR